MQHHLAIANDPYLNLIRQNEDWLMDRVLEYAKKTGYVKYTSTLKEAWRLSIEGLSAPLMEALKTYTDVPDLHPEDQFSDHPIAAFGIKEARLHRTRGISLMMFLGLMKYYRQSYLDLIETGGFDPAQVSFFTSFTIRFFDLVEMGFISEWSTFPQNEQMHELQEANRIMTNEKNRYLTIFESLANPVILYDENHHVTNMNLAASTLFRQHFSSGDIYYGDHSDVVLPEWLTSMLSDHALNPERIQTLEQRIEWEEEAVVYQIFLHKMMDVSGKYQGTILIFHDITTLRNLINQLNQANITKDKFFSILGHDLKTPFNSILGFAYLLAEEWDDFSEEERKQTAYRLKRASENAFQLLDNLLEWVHTQQGTMEAIPDRIHVNHLVEEVVQLLSPEAEKKRITLSANLSPALNAIADANMLRTVLRNLVANAIKFTHHHGGVSINAYADGDQMMVEVSDSGIGIDPATMEKLFRLDESAHRLGTDNEKGTGLGLILCKELVEKNQGKLLVSSTPGKGSTFRFSLPKA